MELLQVYVLSSAIPPVVVYVGIRSTQTETVSRCSKIIVISHSNTTAGYELDKNGQRAHNERLLQNLFGRNSKRLAVIQTKEFVFEKN